MPLFGGRSAKKQRPAKKKGRGRFAVLRRATAMVGSYALKISLAVLGVAMVSLLFVTLYGYLVRSPYVRLEQVLVEGGDEELKQDVLSMSKLNRDTSLLSINMQNLKRKIEKHPWIRSVDIEKRFPRTLVIHVEKEKPWAIVAMKDLYYMDRAGVVFAKVDQVGELDYPVITGVSREELSQDGRLDRAVRTLEVLESEKQPWSLEDLSEVHLGQDGHIDLYFSSLPGIKVMEGELEKRFPDLKKVVEHLQDTGRIQLVKGINLNYLHGVVVSYKTG